ncbi:DUF2207 domain-containing protein [Pelagibius marinus]|uniref:DUF2207 domain-containing protein n=1 Tax=Pelagibius marinus TaxID=2762760 RepID=UPI0018732BD8|nr:DUF2207 domain-containing protein [Pelagibius marinus]
MRLTRHLSLPGLPLGLLLGLLLACLAPPASAQDTDPDRIPRFAADIVIEESGDFLVTEEIDFLVTPGSRKHGIYRDFPTTYSGFLGLRDTVGFEVQKVSRDGGMEPYVLIEGPAGVRLRIGRENLLLPAGLHHYRITYRTSRQLFFHSARDEIYWDVTGNDWAHPIDHAEATIHLPPGAVARETAGYTGYAGEDGKDYIESVQADGSVYFATTRSLQPGEGLTIAVAFPKGYVKEPSFGEKLGRAVADNLGPLVAFLGLVVVFFYFLIQWRRVGRDPEAGVIIPLFEAPEDLSPAATGYIWAATQGSSFGNTKAFTVALTSLAIKGLLTIDEKGSKYTVTREPGKASAEKLPPGEAAVMEAMFPGDQESTVIRPKYTEAIGSAVKRIGDVLRREYDKVYFRHNMGFWFLGVLLAVASAVGGLLIRAGNLDLLPFIGLGGLFGIVFSIPVVLIARQIVWDLAAVLRGETKLSWGAVIMLLFIIPFMVPGLAALYFTYDTFGLPLALLVIAHLANLTLFWFLLKAPTRLGRDLLDQIEGYLLYLTVAEKDRLNMLTAEPEMTVELFEYHLPYAMALDVEKEWTARFTASASAAAREAAVQRQRRWYHTRDRGSLSDISRATSGLAAGLSSTLSTASTRPSSSGGSSGSSGGGSSGGGGGGGGGGSW